VQGEAVIAAFDCALSPDELENLLFQPSGCSVETSVFYSDPHNEGGGRIGLFANGNPIMLNDPLGLFSWKKIGIGSAEIIGGVLAAAGIAVTEVPSAGAVTVAVPTVFLGITHGLMTLGEGLSSAPLSPQAASFMKVYPSNPGQLVGLSGYAISPSFGEKSETIGGFVWDAGSLGKSSFELHEAFTEAEKLTIPVTQLGLDATAATLSGKETYDLFTEESGEAQEDNSHGSTGEPSLSRGSFNQPSSTHK